MKIKTFYASLDEIDEKYHDLFEEKDDGFHLTGIVGIKTDDDINNLKTALQKERDEHKRTKNKFSVLAGHDLEDVVTKLDEYEELKLKADGKVDDEKINQIVESRIKSKLAPVERERDSLKNQLTEKDSLIGEFQTKERKRKIKDVVTQAATKQKIRPEAIEDVLLLGDVSLDIDEDGNIVTRDGIGVTPGVAPDVWLTELQDKRPHWYPESVGGGARGSRSGTGPVSNPWTADGWNLTEQGRIVKENRVKADQLAKAAGTTLGGRKPEKR